MGETILTGARIQLQHDMARSIYKPGQDARVAVLLELLRREDAGIAPPTLRELGTVTGKSYRQARRYLHDMRNAGLLAYPDAVGRSGALVTLTDAGRLAARLAL